MSAASLGARISAGLRDTAKGLNDPTLVVWAAYLMTVPLYVFRSGLPQPGDWLILLLVPLAFARHRGPLDASARLPLRLLLWFTGYVILNNVLWSVAMNWWSIKLKHGFFMSPLFYIYNALVFATVLVMHRRHGTHFLWITGKLILASILSQVALDVLQIDASPQRAELGFNNPNQLGYFAMLGASMLMLLHRRKHVSGLEVAIGLLASSYLCLISASKAALGSIAILAIVGLIVRLRTMLVVGVVFALMLLVANPFTSAIETAIERFETDQSHGFLEERGYDRIWRHPEYWVTGAGEGGFKRFRETTVIEDHEIHSSFGTVFFSYGIVGLTIFFGFLYAVVRRTGLRTWLLVAPSMAYGVTHQGLRFTPFWLLLALVVALRVEERKRAAGHSSL